MRRIAAGLIVAVAFILTAGATAGAGDPGAPSAVVFRGATIWTMGPEGVLDDADLLIVGGHVEKIGKKLEVPAGTVEVDARGRHITPGLIDAHSHTAIDGGVNESSNNVTAEVRIKDVLDPEDIAIYRELAGGLTTANVLHGSANSIGGQTSIIKLRWGAEAPDLLFKGAPGGIKFALGENPKRANFRVPGRPERFPQTREGVMASIRTAFLEARDYRRKWKEYDALPESEKAHRAPPRKDLQLEAIAEVLDGTRKIHAHCYRQDEILALIRLADEFGVRIGTLQHVLEGYKVADEIAKHGAGASTFSDWWAYKAEAYDAIPYNAALMTRRGVIVSVNSDSDELARRLNLEAAKGIKYGGLSEVEALALVTINPARQLGIDKWVGSLEPGKDADVAVWSGHPLSAYSVCDQTWVDGVKRFDRDADLRGRKAAEEDRAALIGKVEAEGKKKPGDDDGSKKAEKKKDGKEVAKKSAPPSGAQPEGRPAPWRGRAGVDPRPVALVGGTIHPVSGPEIPGGTVVFRDGLITAVGAEADVPADARVVNVEGLHVYPGMIDADTVLGLTEIGSVPGTEDVNETGRLNPELRAEIAVNPDSELIPVTRANGITHVLTAPRGGVVSGMSALIRLDGWTWEDMAAATPVAMHVEWPAWRGRFSFRTGRRASEEEVRKSREEALEALNGLLRDARAYRKALEAGNGPASEVERDPALEAMLPVLRGEVPLIVHADEYRQIDSAIRWAAKEKLRIIISGGYDAWRLADELKEREIPVILGPVFTTPERRWEPYDTPYTAAEKLHEAGVPFCIAGGGSEFGASNTRNLPYRAAMAAAFGLPKDEALKAITLYPARILGVGDHLGSIEKGKSASLIVTDGDPLDIRTGVKHVFIDGVEADLMNKQLRLYEKYAARPAPAAR